MTAADPSDIETALRHALSRFATDVMATVEGIGSHVEFHRSRVYALAGALAFFDRTQPEVELVVVTIHLKVNGVPRWEIDAMGSDAVVFAELGMPSDEAERMTGDPAAAAATVDAFLAKTRADVVVKLKARD